MSLTYSHCWGCFELRNGCYAIAAVELALAATSIAFGLFSGLWLPMVIGLVLGVAPAILIKGLNDKRISFIKVYFVLSKFVYMVYFFTVLGLLCARDKDLTAKLFHLLTGINVTLTRKWNLAALSCCLCPIFQIYYNMCIIDSYVKHLKAEAEARKNQIAIATVA